MNRFFFYCFFITFLLFIGFASNSKESAYFRAPNIHGEKLIFTSQGDLWMTTINSNQAAKRLTSHPNIELGARFSTNGSKIAFIASYHNMPAVYVMPTSGGIAKRVTFENARTKLHSWLDSDTLLFSTMTELGMHNSWELRTVDVNTLVQNILPLSDAIEGSVDTSSNTLLFVQHGLQVSTDNANHYKGGAAGELWAFNLKEKNEARPLTENFEGSAHTPMFYKGRVFFVSNESGIDNIWSMTIEGDELIQHTKYKDWPVRKASIHNNRIAFQHGADIKIYDVNNGTTIMPNITLQSDFVDSRTRYLKNPLNYFEHVSVGNSNNKTVITARGRIAIAGTDESRIVNVESDASARARNAILSKDQKYVYAVSDISGDYEIWQFDASGKSSAKQLTKGSTGLKRGLWLSPNGKQLAYSEQSGKLWLLDLDSLASTLVIDNLSWGVSGLVFSSDSRYLSFNYSAVNVDRSQIALVDIAKNQTKLLTSDKYRSYSPAFSHDMQWLYFLSERSFTANPGYPWGDRNMGPAFDKRTQLFAVALQDDAKFPFAPNTELTTNNDEESSEKDNNEKDNKEEIEINLEKNFDDLWQVDIPAGNYVRLLASESTLYLLADEELYALAFKNDIDLKSLTKGVTDIQLSSDSKTLLVQKGRRAGTSFTVVPAKPSFPKDASNLKVKTSAWQLTIDPKIEWQQIFRDAWLMHRDGLFDANMRGIDWSATKQKYMPLLARVNERSELNDIFEQMMGELNALHSQVRGGEINDDPNAPNASTLGASFSSTKAGVQINRIYASDPELLSQASPLAQPGVNAQNGDIIAAINGQKITTLSHLYTALLNQSGQQVLLDLVRGKEKLQTVVVPANAFRDLRYRYQDWVVRNASKVEETNQDIGYLHLYAMGGNDLANFAREFYAQYKKPGLIIDVRRNRGGNIDSVIIEKLLRRAWSFWQYPNGDKGTNMQGAFRGHLVVLADQFTYSDGETFTAGIKALDLGTVIGKQTAGAGVWLSGGNQVSDRGIARVAQFPVYSMDGRWLTEGRGISPDIEVTNLPHATFKGQDAQLAAAIAYLEEKMKTDPIPEFNSLPFGPVEQAADDILPNGR
ncbi:S41 family peptidase [Glaciecola petra]|uniref:Tricorn protease homolog n=1 Tax=Glaciecola petra TaxID=3075602 RepID=A0ABU2ZSV1_9ALTE|nr:S41 family peptidase [Aestuariibacter sp. P117]MDT0595389.1 S41 family peptidase [Aestuariibacter sp. P117]